jgi:hypothetical protein
MAPRGQLLNEKKTCVPCSTQHAACMRAHSLRPQLPTPAIQLAEGGRKWGCRCWCVWMGEGGLGKRGRGGGSIHLVFEPKERPVQGCTPPGQVYKPGVQEVEVSSGTTGWAFHHAPSPALPHKA